MEVAPQVRPTRGLAELAAAIWTRCVERVEAGIGIRLEDAAAAVQVALRMLPLPIRGEAVDDAGWCGAGPGSLVRDIGPDPALFDTLTETAVST